MKIGLVLPSIPSYSETFFRSKIKGLQENGFEVILIVVDPKNSKDIDCKTVAIPNYYIKNKFIVFFNSLSKVILNLKCSKKLFDLCKNNNLSTKQSIRNVFMNSCFLDLKLDWLHFGFGTLAIGREQVAGAINAKMAVSFRGFDIGIYPIRNKNCYDLVWQKTNKIHVISDDIANLCLQNGLDNKTKITKITPAIDTNLFQISDGRLQLAIDQKPITEIVTIARLHWKKGLEYTLEALSIVKKQGFDFHYTIIGDGQEKERLQFAAHQLGLTENITFAGKMASNEVKNELQKATIYLQYSIQEGFCNAVLEAQAMGLLCIVSDAEGLSENVIDGETGFVVPKRSPKLLANKIIETIKLDEKSKVLISKNAIERIENEFNIDKQIKEFIAFYEQ